jgi:hypothetical protein
LDEPLTDTTPNFTISSLDSQTKKRGRPAGSKNKSTTPPTATQVNADIKQALATLETAYNLIATGLVMTGLNHSLESWIESAEGLKKSNEDALRAAPKLAHWIANAGSTGGAATFVITHGMAFATLYSVAREELSERRAQNVSRETFTPDDAVVSGFESQVA